MKIKVIMHSKIGNEVRDNYQIIALIKGISIRKVNKLTKIYRQNWIFSPVISTTEVVSPILRIT